MGVSSASVHTSQKLQYDLPVHNTPGGVAIIGCAATTARLVLMMV